MENNTGALLPPKRFEDPLAYLPCSVIQEYRAGQTIRGANEPSTSIYLIIDGSVKVSCLPESGGEVLMDIYQPDEFFGESAFLGASTKGTELCVAIENTKVMEWTVDQIEGIILARHPQLAIALLQVFVQRSADFKLRIESFAQDNITRRLARALLRFSGRLGHGTKDGCVQMMPFTHEVLAQYIGTSREVVTQYMIQFRRQGHISYSRKGMSVNTTQIQEWLVSEGRLAA
jgi:CRP/FNR family cyclic AMP-dependent transcriptional regulator